VALRGLIAIIRKGDVMKTAIHPEYKEAKITCACGAVLRSKSTRNEIRLDICASCHPFFTGTQKIVDTEGRVERFKKKYAKK
jgi:large subunit ribosomal protein L31